MDVQLLVNNGNDTKTFLPVIEEGIEWTTERRSAPGKLTFDVVKDEGLSFTQGSEVSLKVDGTKVFYGFVFKKKRTKDQIITVTAYDQLRYLQNKDTYVYENKTASQLIKMIAEDYNLQCGTIQSTEFKIESRVEDNTSLFDMIENALDLELTNKKQMYIMYDNFGKITLKNLDDMYVKKDDEYLMIDASSVEDMDYTSTIDNDSYNQIKLVYENEDEGTRDVYMAKDSHNINKWGVLQYYDTLSEGENGQSKADALLELYNTETRTLKLTNVLGDLRVRAGSLIVVSLWVGDRTLRNFMMVEKAVHHFDLDQHTMDLTLRGGEFNE